MDFIPGPQVKRFHHLCVIVVQCAFILCLIWMNANHTRDSLDELGPTAALLLSLVGMVPYITLPIAVSNFLGMAMFNPFDRPKITGSFHMSPFICFRTVTRGDYPNFVVSNASSNKETCIASGLKNFVIEIVTDKPVNVSKDNFIKETLVPKEYQTARGTLFKARALQYCLEPDVNTLAGNEWIVHLDEESLLTEETVLGILEFIHENRADIGQGPINYASSNAIQNWITTLLDCIRLGLDYAFFRFQFTFLGAPVFAFKGSYIVLRNKIETHVGFDFGPNGSIAEDNCFALNAWNKRYTFDFVKGELREQSPFSVMDFIRQRRRWFVGLLFNVYFVKVPLLKRIGVLLFVCGFLLMPLSLSNLFLNTFYQFQRPLYQNVLTGFISGTFMSVCCVGSYLSLYKKRWSYSMLIFVCLFNSIVVFQLTAALESVAVIWGLFTLSTKEFFVIKKSTIDRPSHSSKRMCDGPEF